MRTGADAIETSPASLSAQLIGQIAEPNRLLIRESCAGVEAQLQQLCCDIERVVRRGVQLRGSLDADWPRTSAPAAMSAGRFPCPARRISARVERADHQPIGVPRTGLTWERPLQIKRLVPAIEIAGIARAT